MMCSDHQIVCALLQAPGAGIALGMLVFVIGLGIHWAWRKIRGN